MATGSSHGSPGRRLKIGERVMAGKRGHDTKPVEPQLSLFERDHARYAKAQRKLDVAEQRLSTAQERLGQLDAVQDRLVDELTRCVIIDGQPLKKPFGKYSTFSPSQLKHLPHLQEAKEIHRLVAALRSDSSLSRATLEKAAAADKAASALEESALAIPKLEQAVREARHERDGLAQPWEKSFAGLKLAARSNDHSQGTHLYAAFVEPAAPAKAKKGKGETTEPAAPTAVPASAEK